MSYTPQHLTKWKNPSCYIGAEWSGYFVAPVARNRDSSVLVNCNWDSQWEILKPLRADCVDTEGNETSSPEIVRESHWAVGWVEWVAIHESNEAALRKADRLAERLESYPVLDEMDWSERECASYLSGWESWGCRDFVELLAKGFEAAGAKLSYTLRDFLEDHPDGTRELYESLIPSGDYWSEHSVGIRMRGAVEACTRGHLAQFARRIRQQRRAVALA